MGTAVAAVLTIVVLLGVPTVVLAGSVAGWTAARRAQIGMRVGLAWIVGVTAGYFFASIWFIVPLASLSNSTAGMAQARGADGRRKTDDIGATVVYCITMPARVVIVTATTVSAATGDDTTGGLVVREPTEWNWTILLAAAGTWASLLLPVVLIPQSLILLLLAVRRSIVRNRLVSHPLDTRVR